MDVRKRNSYVILASSAAALLFGILSIINAGQSQQRLTNAIIGGNIEKVRTITRKYPKLLEAIDENNGRTALAVAAAAGQTAIANLLIAEGAGTNTETDIGWTPLHYAVRMNHPDTAKLLITRGADIDSPGRGNAPIHLAAFNGYKDMLMILIDSGADIHAAGSEGWTAVFFACCAGHSDIVELLIGKGAKVDIKDNHGRTPLEVAIQKGYDDLAEQLRKFVAAEQLAD